MAIQETDLVFLESERLDDSAQGGGRMTGNVVPDNQENNLFPDIAPTDRVFGRVRLRKIFAANREDGTDMYLGSHAVLSAIPSDPNVTITLFSTGSWNDVRDDARDYIERFLTKSGYWPALLYGNHLAGQRAIQLVNFPNAELPTVGQTLVLIQDEGQQTEIEQYVRITRVTANTGIFVDDKGEFERVVVLAEITDPLRYDFIGNELQRATSTSARTRIRDTIPSAAARYYGASRLSQAATQGTATISANSLYTPLVPSTRAEVPVLDAQAGGGSEFVVSGGARSVTFSQVSHTDWIPISPGNQALNYVNLLLPKPAPGTVVVSYRAQGRWYRITDNGSGGLTGAGAGSINYNTGSVLVTLNALPDINSAILWGWGGSVHAVQGDLSAASLSFPGWKYQLAHDGVVPGSVTITWLVGAETKKAIDDGDGHLVGDGGGRIDYARGFLYFMPTTLPAGGTTPVVTYQYGAPETETFNPQKDVNGMVQVTLAHPPVERRSVKVRWVTLRAKTDNEKIVSILNP
jgi:hypothetical protein